MRFMCEKHMDMFDEMVQSSEKIQSVARKSLKKGKPRVEVGPKEALEMILGRVDLAQRAYANLRAIMQKVNVILGPWTTVMAYESTIDVGEIKEIHVPSKCSCMGFKTNTVDTLQRIVSTPKLYEQFVFMTEDKQMRLFKFLNERNPDLYANLDPLKKTIILRSTGNYLLSFLASQLILLVLYFQELFTE